MMDTENLSHNNNASKGTLDAERLRAKEKKRTRRDSANRNKETVTGMYVYFKIFVVL